MATTNTRGKVLSPSKLAHVVLRTNKFAKMRDFYVVFLGGHVVHEAPGLVFITYDDEHHRIALAEVPGTKDKDTESCGLEHIAFTYDSLKDLCTAYKQRKALGIKPGWCVNHGPTTSMYYRDPDNNKIEIQVDNFDDPHQANEMMASKLFAENALGTDFDPEELCAAVDRGEDENSLKIRKEIGPRGMEEMPAILKQMDSATIQ